MCHPAERQAAGPAPRTTVAVCDWPDWSVQLMLILSPGWRLPSTDWMSEEDVTVWPATEVIWSPATRPARATADPYTTTAIRAPLLVRRPPKPLPSPPI